MVMDFLKAFGAFVGALAVLFGGVWAYATFLLGPAPEEFDLTALDEPAAVKVVVNGQWSVASGEGGYRAFEVLSGQNNTVVGRTTEVNGTLTVADGVMTGAEFEVQLGNVTTDNQARDTYFLGHVDVREFPTASFVATGGIDISAIATEPISIEAPGLLTFHGVELPATAQVDAQFIGDQVELVGNIEFDFTAHGVSAPSLGFAEVEPVAVIEVRLLLSLAGPAPAAPSPSASVSPSPSPTA